MVAIDVSKSLDKVKNLYENDSIVEVKHYGLLRKIVCKYIDLTQFPLYCGAESYNKLDKIVE